jgi:hypothetical protein
MVHPEDLKAYAKIGRALWLDSIHSERSSLETLTAISLLDLTPERALEKASAALLEKAKRGITPSSLSHTDLLLRQFYRLTPEERLILAALHTGGWSYLRLGRILQIDVNQVEEVAWSARLQLCASLPYPAGPRLMGPRCPEYVSARPWTQRFLDDEIASTRDRIFLQNHIFACLSCREALDRCRKVYFKVEEEVCKTLADADLTSALKGIFRQHVLMKNPTQLTLKESLGLFFQRSDIRWVFFGLACLVLLKILKRIH